MTFSKEMEAAKKTLEANGHSVQVPCDTDLLIEDPKLIDDLEKNKQHCIENNILKTCFDQVAKSDAVLVMNYPKNGIDGYVGTCTFMDLGVAHFLGKQVYLLYPTPDQHEHRWAHEVEILQPIILDGNLSNLK